MTQKKENIQKFRSLSTGKPCTASQYVAEIVCTRKSEKENKGSLAFKFWSSSHKDEYQTQIRLASKIIKQYGVDVVLHYLKSPKGIKTYSLGFLHISKKFVIVSKYVQSGLKHSEKIVSKEKCKPKKVIKQKKLQYRSRPSINTNTILNKIRKAENAKNKE